MKRGFLLSLDAILAITLLLTISLFLAGMSFNYSTTEIRYQRYYYVGKDLANVIEESKISAVSDVVNLSAYDLDQEDMNRSILDVIGSFWAEGNASLAQNLTKEIFEKIVNGTGLNYEVLFDGESIYASGSGDSDFVARLSNIVSGYEKTRPVNGYMAKVYMSKAGKTNSEFIYFGGYEGDGNLTKVLWLPSDANITGVYMELNAGSNFTLYVNGNSTGIYAKTAANFSANNWTICSPSNPGFCSYFKPGENDLKINFTSNYNNYVGGGYLKATYKTSELTGNEYLYGGDTVERAFYLPGIKGIINLYSSFYVPGTLKNVSVYLHYNNNMSLNEQGIPVYFLIGSKEIFRSNATGEQMVEIPEINLSNAFGGKTNLIGNLSNATIPIRFGTDTFAFKSGEGTSDSVLITDVSGSMGTSCDVNITACPRPDCNGAVAGCQDYRINVAKDSDKAFVAEILNYSGNRIGLTSYTTTSDVTHELSSNKASLDSQIDNYAALDQTCIACGIANATNIIATSKLVKPLVNASASWLYNASFPNEDPPDINGSHWTWENYTDSAWNSGQAVLGFENSPYTPNANANIGNNNGNYYFRKHFNLSNTEIVDYANLYVLSDDDAEIYLNGHLINNDTVVHNATYWNIGNESTSENFESYYASGANRLQTNEMNVSPGYWIVNGSGNREIYLMANQAAYPAHGGTDVLVFRHMQSYGYAEKYVNLTGRTNMVLSFWWRMGDRAVDSGEYADVWVWDGSWHQISRYGANQNYQEYHFDEIDLSAFNMINNFTVRFGFVSGNNDGSGANNDAERFYVDDVSLRQKIWVNGSYFAGGDNVISAKLRNNDNVAAKFDLELNATMKRYKAMLVMSDGIANQCLGSAKSCPSPNVANTQAIEKACEARENFSINVYSVGFGSGANMTTMSKIACWNCSSGGWIPGCSRYYNSTNADELEQIYKDIAKDIANATYTGQLFNFTGNVSTDNFLYHDSSILYNYTPVVRTPEYGEITLSFESPRLRESTGENMTTDAATGTKEGWFFIPGDTEVSTEILDSKITSYSSYYWTDRLWVNSSNTPDKNWTNIYWLENFSDEYEKLGDPYIIQIPPNLLKTKGNNSFRIGTGLYPSPKSDGKGASPDDRVIYTLGVRGISLTQYSDVFPKAKGSTIIVYYDSNGDNVAESSKVVQIGPDPSDALDPENDSIDNAFMKLMDTMNFINDLNPEIADMNHTSSGPSGTGDGSIDNPIDLEITDDVNFNSDFISQIPSMWGPAIMEVKIWGG
jgi:hypothetical protein